MKQYIVGICLLCIMACKDDKTEAPAAVEGSTQHPNGITNQAVISRDTSAMLPDSSRANPDSLAKQK